MTNTHPGILPTKYFWLFFQIRTILPMKSSSSFLNSRHAGAWSIRGPKNTISRGPANPMVWYRGDMVWYHGHDMVPWCHGVVSWCHGIIPWNHGVTKPPFYLPVEMSFLRGSSAPQREPPRTRPDHPQIIPRTPQNRPKNGRRRRPPTAPPTPPPLTPLWILQRLDLTS